MDVTSIIVIVVILAIVLFMWPRIGGRRGSARPLNPPGNLPANRGGVFPNTRDPRGAEGPDVDNDVVDDEAEEAEEDVQSQNPRRSI